ncbi:MAG TPA: hypothetical protein DCS42_12470 [Nitrospiraceae bacterium]|jgi:metal-responsive CopG/Arc/MetJ family transcriptional regulator|nr:MAG: hypothetical protein A2072_02105 [Nitrospirae bacterium GWC1_57_7]HAS54866.1 hypothetical protein [Nitrospiraceae bacterium]
MKTAISMPDDLFQEVEKLAEARHASRSEVFVTAVREYLEKQKSKKLLEDINAAHMVAETEEEVYARDKGKKRYRKTVLKERY